MTITQPKQQQSLKGLIPLLMALGVILLSVFISETLPLMMLDLQTQMGISSLQANLIRFVPATAGLLVVPSAGALTDRWGSRRMLVLALLLVCCGCLGIALSHSINTLLMALLAVGLGVMTSTVTGYALLTKSSQNNSQQAVFITAWGVAANVGYLLFPPLGSWVLVHSSRGWSSISLLWFGAYLLLLITGLCTLPPQEPIQGNRNEPIGWSWLINAGVIFSLTSAIPVSDSLLPTMTGPLLILDLALSVLLCWQISHSPQARTELKFLNNPAAILALLALASTCLVDWNYYLERFISLRYLLPLNQTSAWLTPANLSGLIGASLFGAISLRHGVTRTTSAGLLIWLVTPFIFLGATTLTPVWIIAVSVALFTLLEALVATGLQSRATALVAHENLGTFGSLMTGMNTMFESIGGALTADVMINTYQQEYQDKLQHLPLSAEHTSTMLRWLTEGKYHLVLENSFNIPTNIFENYFKRGSTPRLETYVSCLHALGFLCAIMIITTIVIYLGSVVMQRRSILNNNG